MPVTSDLTIDATLFQASSVDASTSKLNQIFEEGTKKFPRWYEVGVVKFRQLVQEGKTAFPVPPLLPNARDVDIPSREPGRNIPVRVYKPDNGKSSRGVYVYFHGGGFIGGSHREWVLSLCQHSIKVQ